ncbi:DgyrCDS8039 [Dimorphilus gyrociliatus]|uniref:DgyrCDS8039 n=1 Tax=Dimorphilus gyrociliatus TaxID=2664684 RepID=A0A7I8VUN8_9ANNE|nr:DgyrCDS8039 [Dimorphilus gyrociliatus]
MLGEVDDLITLAEFNENILVNSLKARYRQNKIYTYLGDILVAVNPFKSLGLYGSKEQLLYRNERRTNLAPHIFAIADSCYSNICGNGPNEPKNQCIIISGESGAGKTESSKLLIKQIVHLSQDFSPLEQQIVQVNPLLEAFGNAQTVMNDNSSRFGKYIMLNFVRGVMVGAKISDYLLEKSRIVHQNDGEENFHAFYYLLSSPEMKVKWNLKDAEEYTYLNNGAIFSKNTNLMKERFDDLKDAMDLVGFSDEEQELLFEMVAGCLTMGNIRMQENENDEVLIDQNSNEFLFVANCFGLHTDEFYDILISNTTKTRADTITRNYSKKEAKDVRDAVAKFIYGKMFGWVVYRVNQSIASKDTNSYKNYQEIGILDIFGFEHFQHNSFEQACINLANEQLQFFFNKHVFILEQEEYKREGLEWKDISYEDNQGVLDLFLNKTNGILANLDETCKLPRGNDQVFFQSLENKLSGNNLLILSKRNHLCFYIKHYASQVEYSAETWVEKNKDTIPNNIEQLLCGSEKLLIQEIFTVTQANIDDDKTISKSNFRNSKMIAFTEVKKRKHTVGLQFKKSLETLLARMLLSQPIFIRCIKPNTKKISNSFDDEFVKAQLLYTGMLETIKIRKEGFAIRPSFNEFFNKYKVIYFGCPMDKSKDIREKCKQILEFTKLKGWKIGKTKIFLKLNHVDVLTDKISNVSKLVVKMQKIVRGFLDRRRVEKLRKIAEKKKEEIKSLLNYTVERNNFIMNLLQRHVEEDKKRNQGKKKQEEEKPTPLKTTTTTNLQQPVRMRKPPSPPKRHPETPVQREPPSLKEEIAAWFEEKEKKKLYDRNGSKPYWFHGMIKRSDSETYLKQRKNGNFLIRLSDTRFNYSLSFKTEERCRHYIIDLTLHGKYVIRNEKKVHRSLNDLVNYYRKHHISNWPNGYLVD